MSTLKNSNFKILKCYKVVIDLKTLWINKGRIFMTIILFFSFMMLIIFSIRHNKKIDFYLKSILQYKLKNMNNNNNEKNLKNKKIINVEKNFNKNVKTNGFNKNKKNNINKNNKKNKANDKNKSKNKTLNIKENNMKKLKKKTVSPPKKEIIEFKKRKSNNKAKTKYEYSMNSKSNLKKEELRNINNKKKKNLNSSQNINIIKIGNFNIKNSCKKSKVEKKDKKDQKGINNKSTKITNKGKNSKLINIPSYRTSLGTIYRSTYPEKKNKVINNEIEYKNLNDQELNTLQYEIAILIDKRSFLQYYWSVLKKKHLILFTFVPANDYNLVTLKICLFLLSFSLYFTINGFFFSDDTMHKIHEDKGNFNIFNQIPQILYSVAITAIINIILKQLSLSEKDILSIKQEKVIKRVRNQSKNIKSWVIIKFIIFFLLYIPLILFFLYFISCFCGVYKNTQTILIEDTLFSFGLSMLYPFGLSLLPAILRLSALKSQKKEKKFLYQISSLIYFLI